MIEFHHQLKISSEQQLSTAFPFLSLSDDALSFSIGQLWAFAIILLQPLP